MDRQANQKEWPGRVHAALRALWFRVRIRRSRFLVRRPELLARRPLPDLDALFDGYVFEHKDTRPLSTAPTVLQPCHLCGYDGSAFERLYQDLQNVDSHGAEIVRCPECAMVIMRPRVRDLGDSWWNARSYLEDCLLPRMLDMSQIDATGRFDAAHNWIVQLPLVAALHAIPEGFPRRVLDVGCSFGGLVHALTIAGFEAAGLEPAEHVALFGRAMLGVDIRIGTYEALRQECDLPCIALTEVLEHCFDPLDALRHVHGALRKGGLLFLSVPNFDTDARREQGSSWENFVSDHYSQFTIETLGRMLQKAGFERIVTCTDIGFPLLRRDLDGERVRALQRSMAPAATQHLGAERKNPAIYAWALKG